MLKSKIKSIYLYLRDQLVVLKHGTISPFVHAYI